MDNSLDENHINSQTNIVNVLNTVKRQYPPIRYVNITPIRLSDIQKELAESATPPPPPPPLSSSNDSLSPIAEETESFITTPTTHHHYHAQTSFESDFDLLAFNSSGIVDADDNNKENEQPTKIQCTISLKDIMQTPSSVAGAILNNNNHNKAKLVLPQCGASSSKLQLLNNFIKNDFKRLTVNRNDYIVLKQLGKGGSSEVFLCFNTITENLRAIKCVSIKDPLVAQDFLQEVKILKQLQNCDRIIKLYDYEINNDKEMLLMVLEAGGADLSTVLKNQSTQHLPKYKLIYYWMEILCAVKQIHSNGIIHADLKPANFLQFDDFCLKLIDFGISTCIQMGDDVTSVFKTVAEGSINYISPEALNNQDLNNVYSPSKRNGQYKISFKSDVWSLGCILYQLIYKRTPYQHISNMMKRMCAICDPEYKISYPTPPSPWVPNKIIETIRKCLQHNMKLRPTVDELIKDCETL